MIMNPYSGDYFRCPFCGTAIRADFNNMTINLHGNLLTVCQACAPEVCKQTMIYEVFGKSVKFEETFDYGFIGRILARAIEAGKTSLTIDQVADLMGRKTRVSDMLDTCKYHGCRVRGEEIILPKKLKNYKE